RTARQVEASSRFILQHRAQLFLPLSFITLHQIDEVRLQLTEFMDLLSWSSTPGRETGPQHLVTSDDLVEAPAQRVRIEPAAQPHCERDIVGWTTRVQLIDEPQPLLRI